MNIGIIGAGRIAEKLAIAINNVDGAVLYSVSSRSFDRSRAFAEKFNAKVWYEGTDDFYKDEKLDLVYIATPNSLHKKYTIDAIKNKKAVLCEKPFALNYKESMDMFNIAEENDVLLLEAMWTKYFPAVKRVKELLDSGVLGEIQTIQGDLSYPIDEDKDRMFKKSLGGGALLDLGIYPITMAHYFLGNPDRIVADAHFTQGGVDESTSAIFSYNSGAKALLTCSMKTISTNEFVISCTNGWIRLNGSFHYPKSISLHINGVGEQHQEFPWETEGYEYQIKGLLEDYNSGLKDGSIVRKSDTLEIMKILDEVRKQIGYEFE